MKTSVDRKDFENLIDDHGKSLYSFCGRLTGYTDDANDLYQQTFLRALELCDRIDPAGNPKAFLFTIAASLYKSRMRKLARRDRIAPREDITDENAELLAGDTDVEAEVLSGELSSVMRKAVQRLKEPLRMTVLLFYGNGFSVLEIAGILRVPQGTVKSRLNKARSILRKDLEATGYETAT